MTREKPSNRRIGDRRNGILGSRYEGEKAVGERGYWLAEMLLIVGATVEHLNLPAFPAQLVPATPVRPLWRRIAGLRQKVSIEHADILELSMFSRIS
jgi:hypothetical protein